MNRSKTDFSTTARRQWRAGGVDQESRRTTTITESEPDKSQVSTVGRVNLMSGIKKTGIWCRQLANDVSSGLSSNRAFRVTFDTVVLAIEPTSSSTPGRLHAEKILFPLAPGQISLLEHRRRGRHSDAFCTGMLTSAHSNNNSVEILRAVRCTGTVLYQACDFQGLPL